MSSEKKPGVDYVGNTTPFYCNDGKGTFVFHKRGPKCRDERGKWDPGGGQLEFGQEIGESVLREVKEEYGCKGIIQDQLPAHTVLRTFNGVKTHWIAIPFFIKVDLSKVKNMEPDKLAEIGFFKLNKLPKPLHKGFSMTYKKYKKYFDKYAR